MDRKRKADNTRRSSRRLQLTSIKHYKDTGSDSEEVSEEEATSQVRKQDRGSYRKCSKEKKNDKRGNDEREKRSSAFTTTTSSSTQGVTKGSKKASGTSSFQSSGAPRKFKWSLQSELVTKQLGKLFLDAGTSSGPGCLLATDVTLVSNEGDCVDAHKVVLILCCPYFRRLFAKLTKSGNRGSSGAGNTVLVMGNVGTTCLKNLIRFIYTGEVDVVAKEQKEFLKIGEFLGISGIRSAVSNSDRLDKPQDLIKVHVIDKRNGSECGRESISDDEHSGAPKKSKVTTSQSDTGEPCITKREPVDDETFSAFEDAVDIDDSLDVGHGRSERYSNEEDDRCSNFSDEIQGGDDNDNYSSDDEERITGRDNRSSGVSSNGDKPVRPGYENIHLFGRGANAGLWHVMDSLTDAEVEENWRVSHHHSVIHFFKQNYRNERSKGIDDYESKTFYCYHGGQRKCPAKIKYVKEDGLITWYSNQLEHRGHRENTYGLPVETKRFVVSMLEQGIRKPEKIFKTMRLLSMDLPTRGQLTNFITYRVRKGEQEFSFPGRKGPKRIRKYTPKPGTSRKRGRPKSSEQLPRLTVRGTPGQLWKKNKKTSSQDETSNSLKAESSESSNAPPPATQEPQPSSSANEITSSAPLNLRSGDTSHQSENLPSVFPPAAAAHPPPSHAAQSFGQGYGNPPNYQYYQ